MDLDTENRVIAALEKWTSTHPHPDGVAIQIADGRQFSPREILAEVRDRTPVGKWLLRVVEHGLERHSFDEVVQGFERPFKTHLA